MHSGRKSFFNVYIHMVSLLMKELHDIYSIILFSFQDHANDYGSAVIVMLATTKACCLEGFSDSTLISMLVEFLRSASKAVPMVNELFVYLFRVLIH